MPKYEVLRAAKSDLLEIAHFTTERWGAQQATQYISELRRCFRLVGRSPGLGRSCDALVPGLRRFEIRKHVVFYIPSTAKVLIVRVLHQRMLPEKSRFEA